MHLTRRFFLQSSGALSAYLGIAPFDLGLFFVSDEGELESDGISDIVVDPNRRTVTAAVAHFSNIAVALKPPEPVAVEPEASAPAFALRQNVPNPFNAATVIVYRLPEYSLVRIDVLSIIGQRVATLENGFKPAGTHAVMWNGTSDSGSPLTSGVYLYRIRAGAFSKARKLTLVR